MSKPKIVAEADLPAAAETAIDEKYTSDMIKAAMQNGEVANVFHEEDTKGRPIRTWFKCDKAEFNTKDGEADPDKVLFYAVGWPYLMKHADSGVVFVPAINGVNLQVVTFHEDNQICICIDGDRHSLVGEDPKPATKKANA